MNGKRYITIDRQYGSGGLEVAKIVAGRLGIPYYGQEIMEQMAKEKGISLSDLEKLDEKRTGSFLHDLSLYVFGFQNYDRMMEPFDVHKEAAAIIRKLAAQGPCVLIGRCADEALRESGQALNLFICASSIEERKRRIHEVDQVSMEEAEEALHKKDRQRAEYYHYFTGRHWGVSDNYDACLNTTTFGYEGCADIILNMMEH